MKQIIPGIYTWNWLSPNHGYNFNGYAFMSNDGFIVIDPPIMEDKEFEQLENLGKPRHILLTNKDHERLAYDLRDRFGSEIYINEKDAPPLKGHVDYTFSDGDTLPGNIKAIEIPDNKSPGETAFLMFRDDGILFIGDALIGYPEGEFSLLPKEKYTDHEKAKKGIEILLEHGYGPVLLGDGKSVLEGGKEAIRRFLERDEVHLRLPVG